jgi:hypothetical protein
MIDREPIMQIFPLDKGFVLQVGRTHLIASSDADDLSVEVRGTLDAIVARTKSMPPQPAVAPPIDTFTGPQVQRKKLIALGNVVSLIQAARAGELGPPSPETVTEFLRLLEQYAPDLPGRDEVFRAAGITGHEPMLADMQESSIFEDVEGDEIEGDEVDDSSDYERDDDGEFGFDNSAGLGVRVPRVATVPVGHHPEGDTGGDADSADRSAAGNWQDWGSEGDIGPVGGPDPLLDGDEATPGSVPEHHTGLH